MEMTIRFSRSEDYPEMMAIENRIWNDKNTPQVTIHKAVADFLSANPIGSTLVAIEPEKGTVLGLLHFDNPTALTAHQKTWLLDIGVLPEAQGLGVGSRLLQALKASAQGQGIHKLSLRVLATNPSAVRFYQKNGFAIEGRLKDEFLISGHFVDDLLMGCILGSENTR